MDVTQGIDKELNTILNSRKFNILIYLNKVK